MQTLSEYIIAIGDAQAAKLLGVKLRTIQSWRRRERLPRPEQAQHIVMVTQGAVDYAGIYAAADRDEAA